MPNNSRFVYIVVRRFFQQITSINLSIPAFLTSWKEQNPERTFVILWASLIISPSFHFKFHIISHYFPFISLHFSINLSSEPTNLALWYDKRKRRKEKKRREDLALSLQIWLSHGVCCPMPWKCQREKEKCEERKGSGSWNLEEKEKMGKDERIYPLENIWNYLRINPCFWEISASCNPVKRAKLDILRKPKKR